MPDVISADKASEEHKRALSPSYEGEEREEGDSEREGEKVWVRGRHSMLDRKLGEKGEIMKRVNVERRWVTNNLFEKWNKPASAVAVGDMDLS